MTIKIEIDGHELEVEQGSMIIEAADSIGVRIPRFCYHKKLSVAANCRMCLVEVQGGRKPMPACATPVTDGMIVTTKSPLAESAQKSVMEFLLINHPLDCPVCDQGGECELQDIAMGYGRDVSRYTEGKRAVEDKDIGPLISTEFTRCIHCTRCVRFSTEVAGQRELGMVGRGEHSEIATCVGETVHSELSGNMIDVCPVGALTAKPSRFQSRPWELSQAASIGPHDCIGSNLYVHHRRGDVMRVVPAENDAINEVWISDRDRFSYLGLEHDQRALKPKVKHNGVWETVDWDVALKIVIERFRAIRQSEGADQLAGLASPSSTVEELYLFQKLFRQLGSNNIDHRLREMDFSDQALAPAYLGLGMPIENLARLKYTLLIGSNIHKEQPIAGYRLRKAVSRGGAVTSIAPMEFDFHFESMQFVTGYEHFATTLASFVKALSELTGHPVPSSVAALVSTVSMDDDHRAQAQALLDAETKKVILGRYAMTSPYSSLLRALAQAIADLADTSVGYLTDGANSAGAFLSGALPHRSVGGTPVESAGLNASDMLSNPRKAYLLMNVEPELDCANAQQASMAMKQADFVVSLLPFLTPAMNEYVDVILPVAPFGENAGTFVNAAGQWQSFTAAVPPRGQARPAWKVLRVLGNFFCLDGFSQESVSQVLEEVRLQAGHATPSSWGVDSPVSVPESIELTFFPEVSLYSVDALVRRSNALQQTHDAAKSEIRMSLATMSRHQLSPGDFVRVKHGGLSGRLMIVADERVPVNCVVIPVGQSVTAELAAPYQSVELQRD